MHGANGVALSTHAHCGAIDSWKDGEGNMNADFIDIQPGMGIRISSAVDHTASKPQALKVWRKLALQDVPWEFLGEYFGNMDEFWGPVSNTHVVVYQVQAFHYHDHWWPSRVKVTKQDQPNLHVIFVDDSDAPGEGDEDFNDYIITCVQSSPGALPLFATSSAVSNPPRPIRDQRGRSPEPQDIPSHREFYRRRWVPANPEIPAPR